MKGVLSALWNDSDIHTRGLRALRAMTDICRHACWWEVMEVHPAVTHTHTHTPTQAPPHTHTHTHTRTRTHTHMQTSMCTHTLVTYTLVTPRTHSQNRYTVFTKQY